MQRRVRGLQSSFRHLLGLFCPFVHRADLYIRYVIIMLATEQFLFMHVYVTYLCVCASTTRYYSDRAADCSFRTSKERFC